jgi:hypothetical protein
MINLPIFYDRPILLAHSGDAPLTERVGLAYGFRRSEANGSCFHAPDDFESLSFPLNQVDSVHITLREEVLLIGFVWDKQCFWICDKTQPYIPLPPLASLYRLWLESEECRLDRIRVAESLARWERSNGDA